MTEGSRKGFIERGRGHDRLLRIMSWSGIVGWAIMLAVMVAVDRAKPDDPDFIPNKHILEQAGIPYHLRTTWDQDLVTYIFYYRRSRSGYHRSGAQFPAASTS